MQLASYSQNLNNTLLWLFGIDANAWSSDQAWHVEFNAQPTGPWAVAAAVGAIGLLVGVWFLYRKEGRELSLIVRLFLGSIRFGVIAIVALMLMEIVLVLTKKEQIPSHLIVLADTSSSMGLRDPYPVENIAQETALGIGLVAENKTADLARLRSETRLQHASRAIESQWASLAEGRRVYVYPFDSKVTDKISGEQRNSLQNQDVPSERLGQLKANGPATGLGDAIKQVLATHRGQPIAGIIVATDGQSNTGADPLRVANQAGKQGIGIYPLAVGTLQGPRDVRVVDLETSPVVFVNDPVEISVHIESIGMKGKSASIVLQRRIDDGPWEEIANESFTLGEDKIRQQVDFPSHKTDQPGQFWYRAHLDRVGLDRAGLMGADIKLSDDKTIALKKVKVIRQTIRVLLIAGYPSPEMQFLRNALKRDKAVEFASWLQTAGKGYLHIGSKPIRRLPATQAELNQYDVLILLDPNIASLGTHWPEMMTKFVGDAGGGLIYVAGEMYSKQLFNPGQYATAIDNSWIKILPVVREAGLFQTDAQVSLSSRNTYTLEVTARGLQDSIFHFANEPSRNREILASLPGMYWHFPVTRAKPGAAVLARHGDPRMQNRFGRHVLLATHLYGPGRTVFIGFDSVFRWRYLSEDYFDGFYARLIDRAGRNKVLLGGGYPIRLSTDKSHYTTGDRVRLRAEFMSESDISAGLSGISAELEVGAEAPLSIDFELVPESPGVYEAEVVAEDPGTYILRVMPGAPQPTGTARAATLDFKVDPPRKELDNFKLNRGLLDQIARNSGGQVFALGDVARLADAIQIRQVDRTHTHREELWDAPIFYGLIILLLSTEWILRKRYRMA